MAKNQTNKNVAVTNEDNVQASGQSIPAPAATSGIDQATDQIEKVIVENPSKEPAITPATSPDPVTEEKEAPEETLEELEKKIEYFEAKAKLVKQRAAVKATIGKLTSFVFKHTEEQSFETSQRPYGSCAITIKDDNGDTFSLTNPYLITKVVETLTIECEVKIVEIDKSIRA